MPLGPPVEYDVPTIYFSNVSIKVDESVINPDKPNSPVQCEVLLTIRMRGPIAAIPAMRSACYAAKQECETDLTRL